MIMRSNASRRMRTMFEHVLTLPFTYELHAYCPLSATTERTQPCHGVILTKAA